MLPKLWKKVLLAVCIIACLYNVTYKLVNRTSLELNLNAANDGNTVFDFTRTSSEADKSYIDGVNVENSIVTNSSDEMYTENVVENTVENTVVEQKKSSSIINDIQINIQSTLNPNNDEDTTITDEETESTSTGTSYKDFITFNF